MKDGGKPVVGYCLFFFFNDTATTEIYTLSLHDALPIWSDLYAYGLILYEMVAGDVPFTGETTLKVMYQRIKETPKSPKLLNPGLPDWFDNVIMRCLERDPETRYQSA